MILMMILMMTAKTMITKRHCSAFREGSYSTDNDEDDDIDDDNDDNRKKKTMITQMYCAACREGSFSTESKRDSLSMREVGCLP